MASPAAAPVAAAAKGAATVVLNAVSCPQSWAYQRCGLVQFPRSAGRAREGLTIVRQHPLRLFCAVQSSPQTETEDVDNFFKEEKTSKNVVQEVSAVEEAPLTLAEVLLQNYASALSIGDEEVLCDAKAQLRAIIDERDSLSLQLQTLKLELDTGKDRFLCLNADFENFRRRSSQEKEVLSDSAKANVIENLLPMIDNFERAKTAIKTETEGEKKIDSSYQGIYKQFVEIMKGLGVSVVETVGKPFDPEVHEAIMREESDQYSEDVISQEFRRGFKLGAMLLRPAMVKVSSGPVASNPPPAISETPVTPEPEEENS